MPKIFESPDGGNTVYSREAGDICRTVVKENKSLHDEIMESKLWGDIRRMGETHPAMKEQLERVKILYHLLKEQDDR